MYDEGTILYFTPFIFPDGGEPKPKYFIVICKVGDKFVLASLPTLNVKRKFRKMLEGCI